MPRIHLFEFEDFTWFPKNLRNYLTDFLQYGANQFDLYKPIVPLLEKVIRKNDEHKIIDLASGGGGGLIKLTQHLSQNIPDLKITLTDYFPNLEAFKLTKTKSSVFDYVETSVDAKNVPAHLIGVRTQFLSLHHFQPEDARQILQNAVDSKSSIAIFEAQERSAPSLLAMFLSPISVLLTTPFIRPFGFGRLIFTYLIPLVPLFAWWDGLVSALRTYSVEEMQELVNLIQGKENFTWEIGKVKSGPGKILFLIGYLKTSHE